MGAVFTGGIGNRLAQHALRGTITSAQAVRDTMLAGGAGSVANNVTGGEKIDFEKAAVATSGGAAGAGIGAKIGNSAVTALERIAGGRGPIAILPKLPAPLLEQALVRSIDCRLEAVLARKRAQM